VLSTTTPVDMIAPFAEALGFDDLIATAYETKDGRYTGRLYEGFVWGTGKLRAVREWVDDKGIDLADCHACSDSIFDVPLLSSVGTPHAVNPDPSLTVVATARRWPVEHWDRPPGVPSVVGLEPYHMLRPFLGKLTFPYARFDIAGIENVPARGPVLLASNHRSYFDVAALALVARAIGRPVRFLGKKEIFDAPVVGPIARAIGGIAVDRGSGSGQPLRDVESALKAGEVVIVTPQGTIPRGHDFFDPVLHGKTGVARLAASTGATVVPVGLWGTERVWPRSARVPDFTLVRHPPKVRVRVGKPVPLSLTDAKVDTETIMQAISALLPAESRVRHEPTAEELARTKPPR
jgi:putative phosphoserine phosphatase/1-acylglycerol-3-phosphate O-acyltransferase